MRAGVFLDALARDFAVTLLVVPVAGLAHRAPRDFAAERATRIVTIPLDGKVDPLWTLMAGLDPGARAAAFAAYPQPAMGRHATASIIPALRRLRAALRRGPRAAELWPRTRGHHLRTRDTQFPARPRPRR
jgi:hypothetical protein